MSSVPVVARPSVGAAAEKIGAIFLRDARLAISYPMSFWLGWVSIAGQVLAFYFMSKLIGPSRSFGFGGRPGSYFDYVIVNLAFVEFQTVAISSFQRAIRSDQMLGTLEAVLATPTSLPLIVLSSGLWAFTLTAVEVAVYLGVASLLGLDLAHTDLRTAAVFLLLTVACMSPVGVLSAASIMTFKQLGPTNWVANGLAMLLGGVLFPVSKLPVALQYVSWMLPITHALNGIRGAVNGATLVQLAPDALWLAGCAALLLPVSLLAFSHAVRRAKLDGTLGHY
ncbi:MAG: ABC transporter permease [Candidatus Eremiobacteraeota bacterium]|nr:ABC transporter permease [Candidatus Eremiobacteraeota bacterium]MBV8596597.1 ABC transporter permease [Candidatus Eremiobacteraeota bacterium]